jgi:hypothetical protein
VEEDLGATMRKYSWGLLLISVFVALRVADFPRAQQFVYAERGPFLATGICLVAYGWYSIFSSPRPEPQIRSILGISGTVVLSIMIGARAMLRTIPGSHAFVWDIHYLYYYPAHHPWLYALLYILLYFALFMLKGMGRPASVAALTLLVLIE